jgi:hypothetical protein
MALWPSSYVTITKIWGFRYGLTHGIGILKIMASPGVFVRVVRALKRFFKKLPLIIKHYLDLNKAQTKPQPPKDGPRERYLRGKATHETNRTPTENGGRFD